MAEEVHWGHVALAAAVVLLVMLASAGSSWVAVGGWVGAGVVFASWCVMLVRSRAGEAGVRESLGVGGSRRER